MIAIDRGYRDRRGFQRAWLAGVVVSRRCKGRETTRRRGVSRREAAAAKARRRPAAAAAEPRDRRWAPTRAGQAAAEVEACPRRGVRRRVHGGGRRVLPSCRCSRRGPGPGRRRRPFRRVVLRRLHALDHGAEPVVRAGLSDELTIEHSRRNAGQLRPSASQTVSLFDRRQPLPIPQPATATTIPTGGRTIALPIGDRSPLNSFLHQINLTDDRSASTRDRLLLPP